MDIKALLKKVQRIEIKTRGLTKNVFAGNYNTAFKGKGMAFSEVKSYQYGDDVRNIDWNVTARFDEPYVKVFEEEREINVMLIVDVSASTLFGVNAKSKRELILELVAIFAFSASANNDKVGAVFVSDKVEMFIPPKKGKKHAFLILRTLLNLKPSGKQTDLSEGVKYFQNVTKKRSTAFVISDFYTNDFLESMKIANRKHDLVALGVYDKAEFKIPKLGMVKLKDLETNQTKWVNTSSKSFRKKHEAKAIEQQNQLKDNFLKAGIDFASFSTDTAYIKDLMNLFNRRKK